MRLSLIAAMAENRVIGRDNALPWHLPADLKRFRRLTTGHAIIMGRRSHEAIGRPLPQRTNIVITRDAGYRAPGCTVVHSLEQAYAAAEGDDEAFVIGGAQVYEQTLAHAERLYLTLVHARMDGDAVFPRFDRAQWRETARERHDTDDAHAYPYTFLTLVRR